jgi:hypothetical protein
MGDGIMIAADGSQSQGSFQDGLLHGWAKKVDAICALIEFQSCS